MLCWFSTVGEETEKQDGHNDVPFFFLFFYKLKIQAAFDTGFSLYKTIALHRNKS